MVRSLTALWACGCLSGPVHKPIKIEEGGNR